MLHYFVLRAVFGFKNWNDGNGKMLVGDGDRGRGRPLFCVYLRGHREKSSETQCL